jgi:hypothetical protein
MSAAPVIRSPRALALLRLSRRRSAREQQVLLLTSFLAAHRELGLPVAHAQAVIDDIVKNPPPAAEVSAVRRAHTDYSSNSGRLTIGRRFSLMFHMPSQFGALSCQRPNLRINLATGASRFPGRRAFSASAASLAPRRHGRADWSTPRPSGLPYNRAKRNRASHHHQPRRPAGLVRRPVAQNWR